MPRKKSPVLNRSRFEDICEAVELEGDTLITNRAYRRWKASTRRSKGQRDRPVLKFKRV